MCAGLFFSTFGVRHRNVSITCLNSCSLFSGVIEKWIESDVDWCNVEPIMTDKEEADSPLKGMEESSNSIPVDCSCVDTKESSNFVGA